MLKKMIGLLCLFLLTYTFGYAAVPVIFYSDLTSGPKTGGQNNKGVFVSIYGKGFGSNQGTSYVSIGGEPADNYPFWSDTKLSFQLGSSAVTGDITVMTAEGTSNGVPFTVRAGNIYFVDDTSPNDPGAGTYDNPWRSPASYYAKINANEDGATCYFRAGTYNGEYGYPGWHANFCILDTDSGVEGQENAFIGYPGERASFRAVIGQTPDWLNFRINTGGSYIVVANLDLYGDVGCIEATSNSRIIGNYCNGIHIPSSNGVIVNKAGSSNVKIYGNEIAGGTSGNKLDHAIYPKQGTNIDIGWNYIHDNDFDMGPMISNNDDGAHAAGYNWVNELIHDNIIDMSDHPSRAIGADDVGDSSTFYIYNNVIIGPSYAGHYAPVIFAKFGTYYYYNNTIYNCGNNGTSNDVFFMNTTVTAATFQNNIVYANSACREYMDVDGGIITNTNNCWYGIGSFSGHSAGSCGTNANAVEADPLFVDAANDIFYLNLTSPCINAGADVSSVVATDRDGITRTVNDIGAYEYVNEVISVPSPTPMLLPTQTINDTTPPAAITNLRVIGYSRNSITLYWTATGDNGKIGTAASYDIRYSKVPIYEGNFLNATKVTDSPTPAIAGTKKSFVITNLQPGTLYYFAIKVKDKAGNISTISNIASGQTKSKTDNKLR